MNLKSLTDLRFILEDLPRKMEKAFIIILFLLLVVRLSPSFAEPLTDGTQGGIFLTGGTLVGQPLSDNLWTIEVEPDETISGNVLCTTDNPHPSSSVVPFGYTWTWGDRETALQTVNGWIAPGLSDWDVPINLVAPSTPGTYYILFGFSGEMNINQVMSATNWQIGTLTWHDGNDYHDMDNADILFAHSNGYVQDWQYLFQNGYSPLDVPVMPIKVVVGGPIGETPSAEILIYKGREVEVYADESGKLKKEPSRIFIAIDTGTNKATGIWYWEDNTEKLYEREDDIEYFIAEKDQGNFAALSNNITINAKNFYTLLVFGKTFADTKINKGIKMPVALKMKGNFIMGSSEYHLLERGDIKLNFKKKKTINSNKNHYGLEDVIGNYINKLESKGYKLEE